MLFLQFFVNQDRYVINAQRVLIVIPLLKMHRNPEAPKYLNGVVDYRGQNIPVLDMSGLIAGKKSKNRISTRIILVDFELHGSRHNPLGLMAEKVTEVLKIDQNQFTQSGINNQSAAYLGPSTSDSQGMIQQILIDKLVDKSVQDVVFQ